MLAAANFPPVIEDLLESTRGNLYALNRLARIAELSSNEQIRNASNKAKMSDFAQGWSDEHDLSLPLTGAVFDIFVDIFHELLVERRLIPPYLEDLSDRLEDDPPLLDLVQMGFDAAYARDAAAMREALVDARDLTGRLLAMTYERLEPDRLTYADLGDRLIEAESELTQGRLRRIVWTDFRRREIGLIRVGPRLQPPGDTSHFYSARTILPEYGTLLPRLSYRERVLLAQPRGQFSSVRAVTSDYF
jgi:hypothetical protein